MRDPLVETSLALAGIMSAAVQGVLSAFAEEALHRAYLPICTIASRRLTQIAVAKLLRVTQPRVSDVMRGRLDLFSADTLIDMLARLGVRVAVQRASAPELAKERLSTRTTFGGRSTSKNRSAS